MKLELHATYRVMLCSGECQQWTYLGRDSRCGAWWQERASGRVFAESGLMYAWRILGKAAAAAR